jgi:hypothetical protein
MFFGALTLRQLQHSLVNLFASILADFKGVIYAVQAIWDIDRAAKQQHYDWPQNTVLLKDLRFPKDIWMMAS